MLFVTGFIQKSAAVSVKSFFLEQHRDLLTALFKGLPSDPFLLIRHVLETFWEGVWVESKIKRTLKINLFGEQTLNNVRGLYWTFLCISEINLLARQNIR